MAEDVAADRPFIAAMVISKARGGLPAPGYFDCAARLGRFAGDANAALTAAALMGMNNVWYPYVEMADDADLKTQRAELRMNAYATHGGVDKRRFELFALAASIVGKCHFCVASHYKTLKEIGMSAVQLRDVGRIAAAVNAAAQVLVAEDA